MLIATLRTLFARDLNKLKQEIEAYHDEPALWRIAPGISNSAGTLCLHLVGNLNTYIGAELGHTGYVRHRDLEFSLRDIPRTELLQKVAETRVVVDAALARLPDAQLDAEYPLLVFEAKTSTGYFLVHLAAHLAYHLGQINYHRRLLDTAG
jgi:uncharacterized damage-inducible protein DinB